MKPSPYIFPDGNIQIAFSGGRTSAYMLYHILEANSGLPDRVQVCFQNTGREMPQTLDFAQNWVILLNDKAIGYSIPRAHFAKQITGNAQNSRSLTDGLRGCLSLPAPASHSSHVRGAGKQTTRKEMEMEKNRRFSDCIATPPAFSEGTPENEMEIETGKEVLRNWIRIARYWMPDRDIRSVLIAAADISNFD